MTYAMKNIMFLTKTLYEKPAFLLIQNIFVFTANQNVSTVYKWNAYPIYLFLPIFPSDMAFMILGPIWSHKKPYFFHKK